MAWDLASTGTFTQSLNRPGLGAANLRTSARQQGGDSGWPGNGTILSGSGRTGTANNIGIGIGLGPFGQFRANRDGNGNWNVGGNVLGVESPNVPVPRWLSNAGFSAADAVTKQLYGKNKSPIDPNGWKQFDAFKFVEPDLSSAYKGLFDTFAAYNKLGISSPEAENRMASLRAQIGESQNLLADQLSGLSRQEIQNFADRVNERYGLDTDAIQRTKEFLLTALGERNKQREGQTAYYNTKWGDLDKALNVALAETQNKRVEGEEAKQFNVLGLINNAASRGASRSQGLEDSKVNEDKRLATLLEALRLGDESSRNNYNADRTSLQRTLDQIREEQQMDETNWRQQNAGLDTDRANLDVNRKENYSKYLLGIARLNAEDEQRKKQSDLERMLNAAAENQRNQSYMQAMAQANQAAQIQAMQQVAAMRNAALQQQQATYSMTGQNATASDAQWLNWIKAGGSVGTDAPAHIQQIAAQYRAANYVPTPTRTTYAGTRVSGRQ